jgi:DNA-binding transcriptional regulator YdaS (Cro superfamily)
MHEDLIATQRRELLIKAIDRLTGGDRTAFGRRLGMKDGAYVRQMLSGKRAISEKTIRHIESIPGMRGWFTQAEGDQPPPLAPLPVTKVNPSDVASRYHVASVSAQRIVELVLRQPNEAVPSWATPALLSIVAASMLLAEDNDKNPG